MKTNVNLFAILLLSCVMHAQTDTLLFENFQIDNSSHWAFFPDGNDTVWVAFDEDNELPFNGEVSEQNWFRHLIFEDSTDTEYGLISLSYMADISIQNKNWFITPPIKLLDNAAVLHWSSAPYQLPRYMDGYKVLLSTKSNYPDDFTETLFAASEMLDIVGDGNSLELSNFTFSEGYFHGDMLRDIRYFRVNNDSTLCFGYLEPHSVSLAPYAGKTVYIAFLHDSFDDFYFEIDDILVTGTLASSAKDPVAGAYRFLTYPNPVRRKLNVLWRLPEDADVCLQIINGTGCVVHTVSPARFHSGDHFLQLELDNLPPGLYYIHLQVNGQPVQTRSFVKK